MTKKQLRQIFQKKRAALTKKEAASLSGKITKRLSKIDEFKNSRIFSIYLPINNEVNTDETIKILIAQDKVVNLPRFFKKANQYYLVQFDNWQKLETGPFGIRQPESTKIVDPAKINLAILPGVAFDKRGVRLGYGKGVFDQLLNNSRAFKIGLAYDFQIVDVLPKEEHDLVMDLVITDSKSFSAKF